MQLSPKLAVMLAVPPLMWAGNAVVGRMVVGSIDPLLLNALRWVVAILLLAPLGWKALSTPEARTQIRVRWGYLCILGLLGMGTYNALQYMALHTSTPLNVTLIASSSPVWMMLVGMIAYGTHPSRRQLLGAVFSLAGVGLVLSRGNPEALLQIRLVEGDLLILLATIGWAIYSWMLAKPPPHMQGEARPAWGWAEFLLAQCVFGVLWAVAAPVFGEVIRPAVATQWSPALWLAILFMAVGPSVVAYRLWGLAVQEAGPAVAAIFYNLTPLFAATLSAALIGEWPKLYHAAAFVLIVAGIAVSMWSPKTVAR